MEVLKKIKTNIARDRALYIILAVSFLLRIIFSVDNLKALFVDISSYEAYALEIIRSGVFSVSAYHPPAYPFFIAGIYSIAGQSFLNVYIVQAFMGVCITYLIYLIACKVFNKHAGLYAAGISLFYWSLTLYSGILLSEILFIFLLLWGVFFLLKGLDSGKAGYFAVCAAFLGLSALTRSINLLLLFVIPAVCIFISVAGSKFRWDCGLMRIGIKKVIVCISVYMAVFCLVLSPWTIRNYIKYKAFIPVDTLGGVNLYIGNNPKAMGFFVDISNDPLDNMGENDYESDKILKAAAIKYIISHPVRFIFLTIWRAILFIVIDFFCLDWVVLIYMKEHFLFGKCYILWIIFMMLCSITFYVCGLKGIRNLLKSWKGLILLGFILYYFLLTSLFYIQSRYKLPVMPFLAVAAAEPAEKLLCRVKLKWDALKKPGSKNTI